MFDRRIYIVDFRKLVRWLTPFRLRKPAQLAWLNAIVAPIVFVYNQFVNYKEATAYRLSITPQVCYLERALNDRYDVALRRIWIGKSTRKDPVVFWQRLENKPVVLFTKKEFKPLVLYTKTETAGGGTDFTINIPSDIGMDMDELAAFMDIYKRATKEYSVTRF